MLAFAPSAHAAPCGITSTRVAGASPLPVTFTATCASATYAWSFGDGAQGTGSSVRHVYSAGAYYPTLTSDAGPEQAPTVTSISLKVTGPPVARYAQYVTLHARVTPRVPVTLRGRRFVNGKLRVRVLGATLWQAQALGVRAAPVHIAVTPTLTVRTIGSPVVGSHVRVLGTLHPASAGTVVGPRLVDTRSAHVAHVQLHSRPAKGWRAVRAAITVSVVQPNLALGATGPSVRELERRLTRVALRDASATAYFGERRPRGRATRSRRWSGLARTGRVDAGLWRSLVEARTPLAHYGGDHIEIDKARQALFLVRGGKVSLVVATSTGATGNTPLGTWRVYRKVAGFDWVL